MKSRGFSIIELLVVIAVIAALSVILIANFPQIRLQLSLSRVAYKFDQDLRRAQAMALASTQYVDAGGVSHAVKGFGLYVDLASTKKYIVYADASPGNQKYDPGTDYIVETDDFTNTEPGIVIKTITNISGTTVSFNFAPPNPVTTITPSVSQNRVDVVFSYQSDPTITKTVSVNTAGLVQVAPYACYVSTDCGAGGLTGSPFCSGNNVYQNVSSYICNNPGTSGSICSTSTTPQLQQTCPKVCNSGICVTCNTDGDCPPSKVCSGRNLITTSFMCNNPGTAGSSCSVSNQGITPCARGCSNGACL